MARGEATAPDRDGWIETDLAVETDLVQAAREILRFGPDAEVVGPPALRDAVRAQIDAVSSVYQEG